MRLEILLLVPRTWQVLQFQNMAVRCKLPGGAG